MKEKTNIEKDEKSEELARVRRGGNWHRYTKDPYVSFRGWNLAYYRYEKLGFRLILQTKKKK